jgi:ligand-binding sensor domain-containing protein/serine phosphatase RsbU (regulator of sigma subunit)
MYSSCNRKLLLIFICIWFSAYPILKAQITDWRIVQYSIPHGLSQSAVNCIMQDSLGFIWIGTQDGLNKFDGYKFTVYRHQPSDTNTISNGYIKSIVQDQNGNIWLGTRDGLNMIDPKTDRITSYFYNPYDIYSISDNEIYNLFIDKEGILWIKTMISLDRLDIKTGKVQRFPHFSDVFSSISATDNYFPIFEDSRGMLWIGSKDGLLYFDRTIEQYQRFEYDPLNYSSLSNNKIKSITEDQSGFLWIGTENGLNRFDTGKNQFSRFYIDSQRESRSNNINEIFKDPDNNFWVATENGLFFFDSERNIFRPFQLTHMERPFFNMEVTSIIEDYSGIYWIGTLSGLYKTDSKSKFKTFRLSDYFAGMPGSVNVVASILPVADDDIWVGTWGSGLFRINRRHGGIQEFSTRQAHRGRGIADDFVHAIYQDSNGRLLIGTRNGVDIYDENTGRFNSFCMEVNQQACNVFKNNRVYRIIQDSKGNYWFATHNGLHRFNKKSVESFYYNHNDLNSLPSNIVRSIIEGTDGFFYIGTIDGLVKFDYENGLFTRYRREQRMETFSISNNEITALLEDSSGNLWVGTMSGLNLFYKNTETFIVFSEKDGLPNNLIYAIEQDAIGKIWVSTNKGLASINPSSWEISRYDMADGLQDYEFNIGASKKSASGELFFGGISGFNYFFPEFIRINKHIPEIVITSVTKITQQGTIIYKGRDTEVIRINPGEDAFSIEFTALDFTRPEKNNFAYRMEGVDNNWVYIGNRPFASFSKLPSGEYTFRVKGSNNDLVWNEEGASIKVIVLTPFYKSDTAIIFYFLFFFLGVYLLFLFRTRNLRKSNQVLKEKELAAIEIARQKEELTIKNRNITDSINYAKRIQVALLPSEKLFSKIFPESFIFYKPKDIVSGDFYWVTEKKNKVFFAVVDCTGHGVPGAFMSIIGLELLRNIINVQGIERPADILNKLNVDFANIFSLGIDTDLALRDGMDIGFCVIHKDSGFLEFAGAFTSLYLVRENSINEIKGDRFSVGLVREEEGNSVFQNQELPLERNDVIYLFSDGYADQFGGTDGRKFKYRRFRHLLLNLHSLPMDEQKQQIFESMETWRGNHEQVDDMLIIGVRPFAGK